MPIATACVRVSALSLARMRLVWVRTVSVDSPSFWPRRRSASVGEHLEDLALAGAEGPITLVEHDRRGQSRVHVELAALGGLDRTHEVLRGGVLPHVALHAGLERLPQQARAAVGGEDHDRRAEVALHTADHLANVHAGPPWIDDHHVERPAVEVVAGLVEGCDLAHRRTREGVLQHHPDPRPDDRMVIHDETARGFLRAGRHPRPSIPPPWGR